MIWCISLLLKRSEGNHFIEGDIDGGGNIYIVVHLGVEVANYYQNLAYKFLNKNSREHIQQLIEEYKNTWCNKEIQSVIDELKGRVITKIPKELAYVLGKVMSDYIYDMSIVQRFAILNRKAIMGEIIREMKLEVVEEFTTIHTILIQKT